MFTSDCKQIEILNFDVAYIVSHGFAARMVMQTNLLGKLVTAGLKVALIAPDKDDANLVEYCNACGVDLFEYNPKSDFWTHQYSDSRKYFLEDLEKNPALLEKHIWATEINKPKSILGRLRLKLLYNAYKLTKFWPAIRSWYKKREQKYLYSEDATKLLNTINPRLLISTYPVSFIEAMLLKAGNQNTNTTTVIHLLSWDNISCKGHFPVLADQYIVWGPIMRDEFVEYYNIPLDKIHVCGVPHFDLHIESKENPDYEIYLNELGINSKKPYIFFAMSSPRFAPKEIDIAEWLSNRINENEFGEDMQMVVRPHPQNIQGVMADTSWIPRLKAIESAKVKVDFPELLSKSKMSYSMKSRDMIKFSQILSKAEISLNSGSTVSIDSLVCNVPVILTAFDADEKVEYWKSARRLLDFTHLRKMVETEGVLVAKNYSELSDCLNTLLKNKKFNEEARMKLLKLQCTNSEKKSTPVVIDVILSLVHINQKI